MTHKKYTTALTIAGFDASGGAGIQADLKTFSALGCYGMSVVTMLANQNTTGVKAIYNVPIDSISNQIDLLYEDINIDVVKIGVVLKTEIIKLVAKKLREHKPKNVVLDPVMVCKAGCRLLLPEAVKALKEELIPLATLITPNLPEAEDLLGRKIGSTEEMEAAAKDLLKVGSKAVLVKGGHFDGALSPDCLAISNRYYENNSETQIHWYESERIETINDHGTGCTISAAITSYLGHGYDLPEAVGAAKEFVTGAIRHGAEYKFGHSHGPVHHFHNLWQESYKQPEELLNK